MPRAHPGSIQSYAFGGGGAGKQVSVRFKASDAMWSQAEKHSSAEPVPAQPVCIATAPRCGQSPSFLNVLFISI